MSTVKSTMDTIKKILSEHVDRAIAEKRLDESEIAGLGLLVMSVDVIGEFFGDVRRAADALEKIAASTNKIEK